MAGVDELFLPEVYVDTTGPPGILADAIDPETGEYLSLTRGFDPTDAAVLTALRTIRATGSAVENVGHRFVDMELVGPDSPSFLEQEARRAGVLVVRLETGIYQPEAIGLYRKLGYEVRNSFGDYPTDDPMSVFMEKSLDD